MAVKVVLKETYCQFKATGSKLLLYVSSSNPSMIIHTADNFDKIPPNAFLKVFRAEVLKNSKLACG